MRKTAATALVAVLCILGASCASTTTPEPVIVEVPVPVQPKPLPLPEKPNWWTPDTDPADPVAYIAAMVHDLLHAWQWGAELEDIIKDHNKAREFNTP